MTGTGCRSNISGKGAVTATLSAVYIPTGREVAGNSGHALAEAWARCATLKEIENHPANGHFLEQLKDRPILSVSCLECFRIRKFGLCEHPTSLDFGPPPPTIPAPPGRYGIRQCNVLYLSDSIDGGLREIARQADMHRWYQKFVISTDDFKIVDFSKTAPYDFISQVFWFTELAAEVGGRPASFLFSQTIAELLAANFDGIVVPGVRGDKHLRYRNVVIFRPSDTWPKWLRDDPILVHEPR